MPSPSPPLHCSPADSHKQSRRSIHPAPTKPETSKLLSQLLAVTERLIFIAMEVQCQCGSIKFHTPEPAPFKIYICHCTICRRQSGSAFGISAMFRAFEIEPRPSDEVLGRFSRATSSGRTMHCLFCKRCGSRLIHAREGVGSVSVRGGCLTGLSKGMLEKAVHIWTSEAIVDIDPGAEQLLGEPLDD